MEEIKYIKLLLAINQIPVVYVQISSHFNRKINKLKHLRHFLRSHAKSIQLQNNRLKAYQQKADGVELSVKSQTQMQLFVLTLIFTLGKHRTPST